MKVRKLIPFIAAIFISVSAQGQSQAPTDSLAQQLQEVIVTARQPATRLVGSTLVSTIPGTALADLGTALDVLAQLPMIHVTDGEVSVTGKSNVEVYIDGRPLRDISELQHMLSSNLRKVELLMAPGAAYASTTGVVLHLTTRRNFVQGLSLTDQFQLQRRRRWSVMDFLNLSYRTDRWELFTEGTINRNNSLAKGSTVNTLMYDGKVTTVGSTQHNSFPTTTGVVKAGFNYASGAQSIGAYYRYNPERGDFNNTGTEWLDDNPPMSREIDKHVRAHSHLASLYYENTFADKYLLHFDGDFRRSVDNNNVATTYPATIASDVNSADHRSSTLWAGKLSLSFPLRKGQLTLGTQDSHTRTTLDYRMLNAAVGQYIPSSLTSARQTSAALFASWAATLGRLSITAGARYEYVDYDFTVDGRRDEDVSRRDNMLTPDLSVGYTFGREAELNLSYKMATVRPPYSQLTGSLSYVGQHEIEGGNPALRDERMHDLQLFGMWKGFILQADFTRALDTYAYVKQLYPAPDLQLLMHPVNIDVSALNLFLMWSQPLRRWTPEVTLGMYRQWLTLGSDRHDTPIFSYEFNNTLTFPHGWTLTANFCGRTRGDMHTNRFASTLLTMDASLGKTLFDKSLTLKLSATDIFNTANNDWTMRTCGIFVDKRQSYDRRGLSLHLIYTLHPRRSLYKGTPASPTELRRL